MSALVEVDWSHRAVLIGAWRESGLPLKVWAEAQGLREARLIYWIKRLRLSRKTPEIAPLMPPLTLAGVQIAPAPIPSAPTFYLHSPGGWKVTLPGSLGPEQLLVLLRGLP